VKRTAEAAAHGSVVSMGWKAEAGSLSYGWEGYKMATLSHGRIDEGSAVLGDIRRWIAVTLLDPDQRVGQQAIGIQAEWPHRGHVVGVAPVMIAGDIPGASVVHQVRGVGEALPDTGPGAVGQGRAFDLIGRRGDAPEEVLGELDHSGLAGWVGMAVRGHNLG
jgi:hypothetical protein